MVICLVYDCSAQLFGMQKGSEIIINKFLVSAIFQLLILCLFYNFFLELLMNLIGFVYCRTVMSCLGWFLTSSSFCIRFSMGF